MTYELHRALPQHLPGLRRIAEAGRLVQSGPCSPLSEDDLRRWMNTDVNLTLVATLTDEPLVVVSAAMLTRATTWYRGSIAWLNGVVTHPDHLRHGLGSEILTRLFWHAEHGWGCTRAQWECEDLPERADGRAFYENTFGARPRPGTTSDYSLAFPWRPIERLRPFWGPL